MLGLLAVAGFARGRWVCAGIVQCWVCSRSLGLRGIVHCRVRSRSLGSLEGERDDQALGVDGRVRIDARDAEVRQRRWAEKKSQSWAVASMAWLGGSTPIAAAAAVGWTGEPGH